MNDTIKPTRTTRRRGAAMLAPAALLLVLAPAAWALGELEQKPGTAGCVSETGTGGACQDGTALDDAFAVAASPDGENVYVASSESDAVAVFDRDRATGTLTQKPGTAGCVSETGSGGACRDGAALRSAVGVAASPDGKSVYVASQISDAVAVFDRDPATGALTQKPGTAGCVSDDGSGGACEVGTALTGARGVAVSADGESVYAVALTSDAVAILDRDPETGALAQKPGAAGCISQDGSGGCQNGTALDTPAGVAPSPDGKSVYVASAVSGAVAVFDRDPTTGALAQKRGTERCVSDNGSGGTCQDGTALDAAAGVTTSPDGKSVYVTSQRSNAVAVFDRDPATGGLTQKPGLAGCISEDGTRRQCRDGIGLNLALGIATSADGKNVYVAAVLAGAVAVFDRDPATGTLTQKPGPAGCISETRSGGCRDGTALAGAAGIATSPDSASVYVNSIGSDAVVVLDRATTSPLPPPPPPPSPPPAPAPTPAPDTLAPTVTRVAFSPHRFRVARAATPGNARTAGRRRRAPRGSRLRFTLSERSDARIVIEQARTGRLVGGRCKPSSRRLRKRRRCTRYTPAGTLARRGFPAGANTIPFSGRIGRRPLAAGRYRATVTATDRAGNRSRPTRATFTIGWRLRFRVKSCGRSSAGWGSYAATASSAAAVSSLRLLAR
jgi:DNA-binding beta-propeller fold protein YncE